jgi:uncharacterized protein (TIGR03086 family)
MPTIVLAELVRLDRRAVLTSASLVERCTDLAVGTPCADWDLGALLAHMTVQHHGFARGASGEVTSRGEWTPRPLTNPAEEYVDACAKVIAAFGALTDPATPVLLPEIRGEPVPARLAVGFHLVDYVVHSWDVAVSIGATVAFADDVLDAALAVARQVPEGDARDAPGAAFAHGLPVPAGASQLEEILLLLGRDPDWCPPDPRRPPGG